MRQQYVIEAGGKVRQADNVIGPVVGFISWNRLLTEAFHASGEIKQHERVSSFQINDEGITYTIVETGRRPRDAAA